MASITERAIVEAFIELLNERPLDRITVSDITNRCGISRNTFYYHFSGIYDLIDAMFRAEEERVLGSPHDYKGWKDGFRQATSFALDNRTAIYHLYKSIDRERLEAYLFTVAKGVTKEFIRQAFQGQPVNPDDAEDLSVFFAVAIEGAVIAWLQTDMKADPTLYIENMGRLLDGTLMQVLDNARNTPRITPGDLRDEDDLIGT
jgi:AcrR family transcriptional regulator